MPNGDVNCLGGHGMKGDIAVACGSYIMSLLCLQHNFLSIVEGQELWLYRTPCSLTSGCVCMMAK